MKFKKSQSGRSMVEMLGVLAIIGVLSVGGIAGYSLSMRRHRANGVVDLISKYALVAYGQCHKQFSDGILDNIHHCHVGGMAEPVVTFNDAGIGTLPAGVQEINFISIDDPKSAGDDVVRIGIKFTDSKLYKAVTSITNGIQTSQNYLEVLIKQN